MARKAGIFPRGSTMKKIKDKEMAANSKVGYIIRSVRKNGAEEQNSY
jgi:hypothetical protein